MLAAPAGLRQERLDEVARRTRPPGAYQHAQSISQDQVYFWSAKWQNDELIAEIELERGEGQVFESARDAMTWLLDVTDDDDD